MTDAGRGVAAMVLACVIWGLSPLYYKLLAHIPPIEVLAHRTLWSAVIFLLILRLQGRAAQLGEIFRHRRVLALTALAALMISVNWFLYIWSVGAGHVTQTSLGYYLFPLVAVLLGRLVFGEGLTVLQWFAVALAALAVATLTLGLRTVPTISLVLASTFGLYGMLKKRLSTGPVVSVTAEVIVLAPIALLVLARAGADGRPVMGDTLQDALLLFASGGITATPLILFSYATRRARLATVGMVQYLNPTLQFLCAVVIFSEPFGPWHAAAFAMIWAALAIYSVAVLRRPKSA